MYLMAQLLCLRVVDLFNFPRPPKLDQNMLHFTLFHQALQNSAKFRGNLQIPQKQANSAARLKIPRSEENDGP